MGPGFPSTKGSNINIHAGLRGLCLMLCSQLPSDVGTVILMSWGRGRLRLREVGGNLDRSAWPLSSRWYPTKLGPPLPMFPRTAPPTVARGPLPGEAFGLFPEDLPWGSTELGEPPAPPALVLPLWSCGRWCPLRVWKKESRLGSQEPGVQTFALPLICCAMTLDESLTSLSL